MIIPTKGSTSLYSAPLSAQRPARSASSTMPSRTEMQFDQVQISRDGSTSDQFRRELVSRLVREVRTAHSSSDVARIKSEVQSGSYQPNPNDIAARLLLEDANRAT